MQPQKRIQSKVVAVGAKKISQNYQLYTNYSGQH